MIMRFRPLFLALGLIFAYSPAIQPMASKAFTSVCALTRWVPLYCVAFDAMVLNNPDYIKPTEADIKAHQERSLKKRKQLTSVEFPKAHAFFKSIADKRDLSSIAFTVQSEADCMQDGNYSEMGAQDLSRVVFIRDKCIQQAEDILNKEKFSHDDQASLAFLEGVLHHELTHIERNSVVRKNAGQGYAVLASFALLDATRRVASKVVPALSYSTFIGKTLYGLTSVAAIPFSARLSFIYNQYDEYKADDGIPARKDLLEEQAKDYERMHVKDTERGRYGSGLSKKIMDTFPVLYHFTTEGESHPPHICRAIRFRKRIQELEKQEQEKNHIYQSPATQV